MAAAQPIHEAPALDPGIAETKGVKSWFGQIHSGKARGAATGPTMLQSMDEASFRALYERMARPLWAYLCHASGNNAVADDLVQDTFCRFLSSAPPPMNDAQTKSYLYRIATNLLHDRWRRGETQPPAQMPELHARDEMDSRIAVRSALRELKPRERQLLWLAYVEGLDHREIGQALGLRSASVRLLLFRARHKAAAILRPVRSSRQTDKRAGPGAWWTNEERGSK